MNNANTLHLHARGRSLEYLQDAIHGLKLLHKQAVENVQEPEPSSAKVLAYQGTKSALAALRAERNHARNTLGLNRKGQPLPRPDSTSSMPSITDLEAPAVQPTDLDEMSPAISEPPMPVLVGATSSDQLNGYMRL